ncbi:MAG: Rieske (2Fe-2S) protein [Planctomycetes bacterium]|nr:Rieske (2Fe-2S) protein [Planctomycetota bacterium]
MTQTKREWVELIALSELPTDGTGRALEVGGVQLAVFLHEGSVRVLDGVCPHQGALLGDGVISRGEVTCPFHGWHFDLETGASGDGLEECVAVYESRVSDAGLVEVFAPSESA